MSTAITEEPITAIEVLAWLQEFHPELHAAAEVDRKWVWISADLRKDEETRASIKAFGFKWAKHGHPLPSGAIGNWAHHCDTPMPFKRRGSKPKAGPDWEAIAADTGLTVEQLKNAIN